MNSWILAVWAASRSLALLPLTPKGELGPLLIGEGVPLPDEPLTPKGELAPVSFCPLLPFSEGGMPPFAEGEKPNPPSLSAILCAMVSEKINPSCMTTPQALRHAFRLRPSSGVAPTLMVPLVGW